MCSNSLLDVTGCDTCWSITVLHGSVSEPIKVLVSHNHEGSIEDNV